MPEQISTTRQRQRDEDAPEATATDQRNEQLGKDVACCLDDIDTALASAKSERETAIEEFREIQRHAGHDGMGSGPDSATQMRTAEWQAKYAHLGYTLSQGCCGYSLHDPNQNMKVIAG